MSKIAAISKFLEGKCELPPSLADGLQHYHTSRVVRDAGRIRDHYKRFLLVRTALRNYHVQVTWSAIEGDGVRIWNINRTESINV